MGGGDPGLRVRGPGTRRGAGAPAGRRRPSGMSGRGPGGERIVTCSVTGAGAALARRLPYEHHHGRLVATVRERWDEVDGFVLVCATGIAVRAIASRLADKTADPAVVVVGDGARFAVALTGGDPGGANGPARGVAALPGAEAGGAPPPRGPRPAGPRGPP